jgi:hypothetical protein
MNLRGGPGVREFRVSQDLQDQLRELNKTPSDARRVFADGPDDVFGRLRGQQSRPQFRPELEQHKPVVVGLSYHD